MTVTSPPPPLDALALALIRRLLHDVASPAGGLILALDLDDLATARTGGDRLLARLGLSRLQLVPQDGPFPSEEAGTHLRALLPTGIELDWPEANLAWRDGQGLSLLVEAAAGLLAGRGEVQVQPASIPAGTAAVRITGRLRTLGNQDERLLARALQHGEADDPAHATGALAARLLGPITMTRTADTLCLTAAGTIAA